MKRSCPFPDMSVKRVRMSNTKRKCEFETPTAKRFCTHSTHKRKYEGEHEAHKRLRTEELDSLKNMLIEAYEKIHYLESRLHQSEIEKEFYCSKMNQPVYNHGIFCY